MNKWTRGGLIAAAYVVLVFVFQFASFGPIQFRIAEALTLLPMVYPEAIGGIYIGALLANILGGQGPWDIFAGSLISLVAAYITFRYKYTWVAYAAPIVLNAVFVSAYLYFIFEFPSYLLMVLSIGFGQAVVVLGLGIPFLRFVKQNQDRFL
ncbi:MAG: QueT transporter family protein [Bacillota bacterium]|nr:QueT transporter family protein [Bacillota bacterium]HHU61240.1 QueT transporter family protein [Natronincola sp.]